MNSYVLKINDSTYVSEIHWIAIEIPHKIETSDLQNAMLVTDEYLSTVVMGSIWQEKI